MRGFWPAPVLLALLVLAAPAHASTAIGMVATSDADNCSPSTEFMQEAVGTGGPTPSYDVPAGGGVITSWSTMPGSNSGTGARLKVYRPTADPAIWTVVGESAAKILTPSTLNTSLTRIPVAADDRIAIRTASGNGGPCDFPYPAGFGPGYAVFVFQSSPTPAVDPGVGLNVTFTDAALQELVNIAAKVEPDTDGDGFGDETQDLCPGSAGTVNGCIPPAPPAPPGPPAQPTPPALVVTANAKSIQHVLRQHGVVISVTPNVASTVTAGATLNVPSAGVVVRFKRARKTVAAGAKATLKLTLSKAQLKRVKGALRRHRRLFAKPVVTSTAAGATKVTRVKRIQLKP
jgi:hypothetical protein